MKTFAIDSLGIVLTYGSAAAQTPQEQEKILSTFQENVVAARR